MKLFGDNRGVLRTLCLILHLPVHSISPWAIFWHPIKDINMASKNQSSRLTLQHKASQGVVGIFGAEAKYHDLTVKELSPMLYKRWESTIHS